ncbi:hypothetical protein G6F59_017262 [Rhizopus arrhizus]|nr:hypothetical protein G6F59_017262 [Rhizopus arrhizus]
MRAAVGHGSGAGHPPPDPGRDRADRLSGHCAQQVPGQDRVRLEQARWPVRGPAGQGAGLLAALACAQGARRGQGAAGPPGATGHPHRGRPGHAQRGRA